MRRRRAMPRIGRTARWLRGIRPDRNPLRRTADRAELVILVLLVAAFAALAPVAASLAARWAAPGRPAMSASGVRGAPRQVPAVLLTSAPAVEPRIFGTRPVLRVRARWTGPDGAVRTGEVQVPAGSKAGATVMVWVDASGRLSSAPARPADRQAEVAGVLITAALVLSAGRLARWLIDRRRMAAWDADWRVTGPRWSSRR